MTKATLRAVPEAEPELIAEAAELAARAACPAVVGNVKLGTAGWTDKTLIASGTFYPPKVTSPSARLQFYAEQFSLVEVDATYYTLIAPGTSQRWVRDTPPEFVFDVKAHPILTGHPVDVTRLPADLKTALNEQGHDKRVYPERMPTELAHEIERRFMASVEPILQAGKLGCVMLQFPPWFTATKGNVKRIEDLAQRWTALPLAVEFRHKSWLAPERQERVFDMLGRLRLSYICVDEPDVERGGVPPVSRVTNPELAIVRFHGKNFAGWQKRAASVHERFNHVYSTGELLPWVPSVKRLAAEAQRVHAVFNNCVRNYAVLGAKGLSVLLEQHSDAPDLETARGRS